LYQGICGAAEREIGRGGPLDALLSDWHGDPLRGFLALRLLGAVHERVLAGEAPRLARFYPSVGGHPEWPAVWDAFLEVVEEQCDALRPRLESFPQTNEVQRCAGLLGGFLRAASVTGLPLRLRETGCSAGLNLQWDRYRYELGPHRWGEPDSPVKLSSTWEGDAPQLDAPVRVTSRAGCDLDPRRIEDPEQSRLLEAYVWPDQLERLERLRAALGVARQDPARVDRARARDWLPTELAQDATGECTVVYHSSFWLYLSEAEKQQVRSVIADRGARATSRDPLAWLRHEDGEAPGSVDIRLRLWPGEEDVHLGQGHPHGRSVSWRGESG